MGCHLLDDHLNQLLDEFDVAQRAHRTVQAYVKLHMQRQEQGDFITISTSMTVTWLRPTEDFFHTARLVVDSRTLALDHPSCSCTK